MKLTSANFITFVIKMSCLSVFVIKVRKMTKLRHKLQISHSEEIRALACISFNSANEQSNLKDHNNCTPFG